MTKQQMIEKHGTPAQFKIALGDAIAQGFVTFDEAAANTLQRLSKHTIIGWVFVGLMQS